jgi:hypothetical protein
MKSAAAAPAKLNFGWAEEAVQIRGRNEDVAYLIAAEPHSLDVCGLPEGRLPQSLDDGLVRSNDVNVRNLDGSRFRQLRERIANLTVVHARVGLGIEVAEDDQQLPSIQLRVIEPKRSRHGDEALQCPDELRAAFKLSDYQNF